MEPNYDDALAEDSLFLLDLCPKQAFPSCSPEDNLAQKWMDHLCTYEVEDLNDRRIRNIYISHLCTALIKRQLYGPFLKEPPSGKLEKVDFNAQPPCPNLNALLSQQLMQWPSRPSCVPSCQAPCSLSCGPCPGQSSMPSTEVCPVISSSSCPGQSPTQCPESCPAQCPTTYPPQSCLPPVIRPPPSARCAAPCPAPNPSACPVPTPPCGVPSSLPCPAPGNPPCPTSCPAPISMPCPPTCPPQHPSPPCPRPPSPCPSPYQPSPCTAEPLDMAMCPTSSHPCVPHPQPGIHIMNVP